MNFFIIKDNVTALAERAGAPLGEPDPLAKRAIGEALLPGLEGIWDQCGLGFDLGLVKVVDPGRLNLSGRTLTTQPCGERVILADGRTDNILGQALQAVNSLVRETGRTSLLGQMNVFVVGSRVSAEWQGELQDVEGFSGANGIRYALVRWGAISFDELSQSFLRPKQVTATLAHELGHVLGLGHPGQDGLPGTERSDVGLGGDPEPAGRVRAPPRGATGHGFGQRSAVR